MYVNLTDGNLCVLSYGSLVKHCPTVNMLLTNFHTSLSSGVIALVIHMEIIPNQIFEYCASMAQHYI